MEDEPSLHLPPALRQLQPTELQAIHHQSQVHQHAHPLTSQLQPELDGLDGNHDTFAPRLHVELSDPTDVHHLQGPPGAFEQGPHHPFNNGTPVTEASQTIQSAPQAGQFGILTPVPTLISQDHASHISGGNQQEEGLFHTATGPGEIDGHITNLKIIPDPPELQAWRQRLFDVNETITLTEEELVLFPLSSEWALSDR